MSYKIGHDNVTYTDDRDDGGVLSKLRGQHSDTQTILAMLLHLMMKCIIS